VIVERKALFEAQFTRETYDIRAIKMQFASDYTSSLRLENETTRLRKEKMKHGVGLSAENAKERLVEIISMAAQDLLYGHSPGRE